MGNKKWLPSFWVILSMDVLGSLMIIVIVVALIASTIVLNMKGATSAAATGEAVGIWRNQIAAYYALHGEWPESIDDLKSIMPEPNPELEEVYEDRGINKEIRISGGALDLVIGGGALEGEVLTVHPAVPAGDPLGPVKWVAGRSTPEGWTVIGEDHTTVEEKYILPVVWRR